MAGITLCVVLLRVFRKMADVIFHRGPLICSYVIQNLSWEFGFWFVSIPLGINTIMVFFFVPEVCLLIIPCFHGIGPMSATDHVQPRGSFEAREETRQRQEQLGQV